MVYYCYPQGRHKALTMSYDDGRRADERLVGLFNQYGIKGTFHLNSGLLGDGDRIAAEEVPALYRGHEVSVHTRSHPTLARCPQEQIVQEIVEDRKALESLLGVPVRGMSYPNGSFTSGMKGLLPPLGIEYARTVQTTGGFGLPDDLLEWRATCHHNDRLLERAEAFAGLHKKQYLYLMYVWGHSYEFDNDGNWELMESFGEIAGGHGDIWYATNIEWVHYMKACERLLVSAALDFAYNPSVLSVWLEVAGRIVEVPGGQRVQFS
ncbi:polysaccharide deacetylase family protein [Paenibacillus sp. S150]|uniref:polysaccharide deacetylase family protein n=1 Tax=Paenibacillus sp. S150 TaxID=2749826 RepID=UPI001C55A2C9|nr:polysaccharide deacetylase family protein [Paenibacillus sp. S150]MBW4082459.1 polysaccharide deacetylase family protein [Paenibacillus sp. S150]